MNPGAGGESPGHSPGASRTVFVSGNFNILHPGHLRLLRFARELGDRLIVGVQSDRIAGSAAHISETLRLDGIASNSFVDEALLIDEPPSAVIERLRPDIVVKGKEHENRSSSEHAALMKYGGQLVFCSGDAVFSSLDLIRMDLAEEDHWISQVPDEYLVRHGIEPANVLRLIENFPNLCVCVVGDLIVDEYITCDPLGMSQEDPTIVVTPIDAQRFVGGAGIVSAHAAGLGARSHFLSVTGDDEARDFAVRELDVGGVKADLLADNTRPTTLKQRYRANGMTLLRVSHVRQAAIDLEQQNQVFEQFNELVSTCQLLVFSDFNYGCLPQSLVDRIAGRARELGLTIAADSQCSSQIGDISRFHGMDLLTPTEHEARLSLRNHEDGLVVLAEKLRVRADARNIILKLGAEGALLHIQSDDQQLHTDRIRELNSSPRDVAGAGDSLLISSAMTLAVGASPWEAAYIGAVAAAVQVSRIGNIPLCATDLTREIR